MEKALENGENPRDWKLLLARTVTALYHSEEETRAAEEFFKQAFTKKEIPNTEVKLASADNTWLETAREDR